jgi:hypothetical protein
VVRALGVHGGRPCRSTVSQLGGRGPLLSCLIFATTVGASARWAPLARLGSAPPLGGGPGFVSHTTTTLKEGYP